MTDPFPPHRPATAREIQHPDFPIQRLQDELSDELDAEFEQDLEELFEEKVRREHGGPTLEEERENREFRLLYFRELRRLQIELIRMQDWIQETGYKLAVLFEGRDAAGKGGAIKRITQRLNPRVCRVTALPAPSEQEKTQLYFQRYVPHLPSGGEMVLFDRSWYNRAGVETVMGFATPEQVDQFYEDVPLFEKLLTNAGIHLIKYWFSIEDEEQEFRFLCRVYDPLKQWKLSPMDLQSRARWEDYTKAKERMLRETNFDFAPWHVVAGNHKKRARLNCMRHLLEQVPYEHLPQEPVEIPPRIHHPDYHREPVPGAMKIPDYYGPAAGDRPES